MSTLPSQRWSPAEEVERRIRTELFERGPAVAEMQPRAPFGLHVCPSCLGSFVIPGEDAEVVAERLCRLDLLCVSCGWEKTGVYSEAEIEALDREIDRCYSDMLWALEVLWIGNEEEAIERFSAALSAGAILPEDF